MKTTYEIVGFEKIAELDNYENGCIGKGSATWVDCRIHADTIDRLKKKILSFIGAEPDAMEIDACEEAGRIDVHKTENADGCDPTAQESAAWKAGELDLYAVTYTCMVQKVARETISLID